MKGENKMRKNDKSMEMMYEFDLEGVITLIQDSDLMDEDKELAVELIYNGFNQKFNMEDLIPKNE